MTYEFPAVRNLVARSGDTWAAVFSWKQADRSPFNLTGYTARMMLRRQTDSPTPAATLSTNSGGGINIDGTAGTIFCTLTRFQMEAIPAGAYVYDLELTSPTGTVTTIAAGRFDILQDVSR